MCKLSQDDTNAMAPAGAPPAASGMTFGGPATPSPSASGPAGDIGGGMMPGPTPQKDTKFKKLLQVVVPIVGGGLIGGFGGNWRQPGSGNEAASNFFHQQSELALQRQNMQAKLQQDAFLNQLRVSEERRNNFYDNYLKARTEAAENPTPKPVTKRVTPLSGYPGYELEEEGPEAGTVSRIMRPAGKTESGFSDLSNIGKGGEVPMGPPQAEVEKEKKDTKPRPVAEVNTDKEGVSTTQYRDMNPDSPTYRQVIRTPGEATRNPKPNKSVANKGQVEKWAQAVADRAKFLNVDPEEIINAVGIPDEQKSAVRQRIREMNRPTTPSSKIDLNKLKARAASVPTGP